MEECFGSVPYATVTSSTKKSKKQPSPNVTSPRKDVERFGRRLGLVNGPWSRKEDDFTNRGEVELPLPCESEGIFESQRY